MLTELGLHYLKLTPIHTYIALFAVDIPAALLISYLFHLAFERPFMTSHMRRAERQLEAVQADPSFVSNASS